jgi:hypothetical protein
MVTTIGGGKAPGEPLAQATDVIVTVSRSPAEAAVPVVVSGPPPQNVAHVSQARYERTPSALGAPITM